MNGAVYLHLNWVMEWGFYVRGGTYSIKPDDMCLQQLTNMYLVSTWQGLALAHERGYALALELVG